MNRLFKKLRGPEFCRLFLPFIIILVVGILLTWYPLDWFGLSFVHSLRDALVIAGLVGLCIDIWAASVLIEHTSAELSERLVGYGLPLLSKLAWGSILEGLLANKLGS